MRRICLILLLLTLPVYIHTEPRIAVKVSHAFGFEPLPITVTTTIPQAENNREVCVGVDNGFTYSRTSCRQWGKDSSITRQWIFKDLPAGEYIVWGMLNPGRKDTVVSQYAQVIVMETGPR